jgi:hypothetical protein
MAVWCQVENVASTCIPDKISANAFPVLKNAVCGTCSKVVHHDDDVVPSV